LKRETIIDATTLPRQAVRDLIEGLLRFEMWWRFAVHDIKQRFKRSFIGPFWLTLSMGVMVGVLALISSSIFQRNMAGILPYIAVGLIFWGFLTSCINEGAEVFIGSARYIRNIPMQLSIHLYRMIARNIIILGFNMVIYLLILAIFPHPLNFNYLLVLPGFALFLINVASAAFVVAILSARYRDIPYVISNLVQVIFFVTPVFWSTANLPNRPAFVTWNPVYYMLEIVRSPLLGEEPSLVSWGVSGACALIGCACLLPLYRRAYPRISYWV
jgi:lipopolysaccharide transport system permease protein